MNTWQPIETAPKDGSLIDLWIVGSDADVDFYCANATKVNNKPLWHGRATDFRWEHKPPNQPNWYLSGGLGYPLSPEVEATHWMRAPKPPLIKQ